MLAYGATDRHFFRFTKDAAYFEYPIEHIELVKVREEKGEKLVPTLRETVWDAVTYVGLIEVCFPEPKKLVNFSSLPPVETIEIAQGLHGFEVLSIEFPKKTPNRFLEIVVIPGTVHGMAFAGVVNTMANHQRFWERKALQKRLLEILARRIRDLVNSKELQPA